MDFFGGRMGRRGPDPNSAFIQNYEVYSSVFIDREDLKKGNKSKTLIL